MSTLDPKNSQPEALAKLAETARDDNAKPSRRGINAGKQTAAIPADPELEQDAATKVLVEGVTHDDHGAREAIDRLPDRAAKR